MVAIGSFVDWAFFSPLTDSDMIMIKIVSFVGSLQLLPSYHLLTNVIPTQLDSILFKHAHVTERTCSPVSKTQSHVDGP
jgi:hypothetical protein